MAVEVGLQLPLISKVLEARARGLVLGGDFHAQAIAHEASVFGSIDEVFASFDQTEQELAVFVVMDYDMADPKETLTDSAAKSVLACRLSNIFPGVRVGIRTINMRGLVEGNQSVINRDVILDHCIDGDMTSVYTREEASRQ